MEKEVRFYTQGEIAKRLGVTTQAVGFWLKNDLNKVPKPTNYTMKGVALWREDVIDEFYSKNPFKKGKFDFKIKD